MSDPNKIWAPGDELSLGARQLNMWTRGAQLAHQALGGGGSDPLAAPPVFLPLRIRNATGAAIHRLGVVAFATPTVLPADNEHRFIHALTVDATIPSAPLDRFAICLEPIADNGIGLAAIGGVLPCRVIGEGTRAQAQAGDGQVLRACCTGYPILWQETGEEERYAVIHIGISFEEENCDCSSGSDSSSASDSGSASGSDSGSASDGSGSNGSGSDGSGSDGTGSDGSGGTGGTGGTDSGGSGTSSGSGSDSGSDSGSGGTGGTGGSDTGSGKDTAIVPVSWFQKGYAALFVLESPEVRFDDVLIVVMSQVDATVEFDWRYVEVCEPDSIEVCGHSSDLPALYGVVVSGNTVRVTFEHQRPGRMLRLVMRMTGIRKGFAGMRFPERSERQFKANNAHIDSAYPRE